MGWIRGALGVAGGRHPVTVDGTTPEDAAFEVFLRPQWTEQGRPTEPASAPDLARGDDLDGAEAVDAGEVREVYLPLARWIEEWVTERRESVGDGRPTPAVVGITGSVAAGKTTTARVLAELLRRGPDRPTVDLLATDSFLLPNRVLGQRGLLGRKGFPETYDRRALAAAVEAVRSGQAEVAVPVYRHAAYDIVPDEVQWIRRPDLLLVEGLAVLRDGPVDGGPESAGSRSLVDLAVYIDADESALHHWHTERLLGLRSGNGSDGGDGGDSGGGDSGEFLRWLRSLSDAEALAVATSSWSEINLVNLREHVAPTRARADVILEKDDHHRVHRVLVRHPPDPSRAE